jgi:hypothetical protein
MASNPQLATILAELRTRSGEPDPLGRWSDTRLIPLINRAQVDIGLLLQRPEATVYFVTHPNTGEYSLEEHTNILRVKVGGPPGQNILPTTIDMLEGTQYGLFDQSSTSPPFTPKWLSQPPLSYPVQSSASFPAPLTIPWATGNRPSFYLRGDGAVIGFVPTPTTGYVVQIDNIAAPRTLVNSGDTSDFPDKAMDALLYKTMAYMAAADHDDQAFARNMLLYGGQNGTSAAVGQLLSQQRATPRRKSRAPLFVTMRTKFSGPARIGSGQGRLGN